MTGRMLVAGVGNVFLGDDGFGVEVARRLADTRVSGQLPDWVSVVDYGIRGMHLAYDLAGGDYDTTVLVDATSQGDEPGTVCVIELDPPAEPQPPENPGDAAPALDAHGISPDVVLNLVALLGADPGRVLLVGCEPATLDPGMGLSPVVTAALDTAMVAVAEIIREARTDEYLPPEDAPMTPAGPAGREQV
ncbi:MAG TPA: hydrogenase maturation protease [Pseudonocardiaceae bacterium]